MRSKERGFITASGFRDDRRFALANQDNDFVSLRSCPVLVHLGCIYRDGIWLLSWNGEPGPVVSIPEGLERLELKIWGEIESTFSVSVQRGRSLAEYKAEHALCDSLHSIAILRAGLILSTRPRKPRQCLRMGFRCS